MLTPVSVTKLCLVYTLKTGTVGFFVIIFKIPYFKKSSLCINFDEAQAVINIFHAEFLEGIQYALCGFR